MILESKLNYTNKQDIQLIVTGATGFVGRNLLSKITNIIPNNQILCLIAKNDNQLEISGRNLLKKLGVNVKYIDLLDQQSLYNLPKNPKIIIHLAAETDTSKKNHSVNDFGIKNLYMSFKRLNRNTHFIYIGTMVEVVGRPNCNKAVNEETIDYPTNEYTRTKLIGEKFIIQKCIKDKFRLTVIRPNTIYGKNIRKNSLFDLVKNMTNKHSIITRINWPGKSALIHVDDLTDLIIKFAGESPAPGKPQKYLAYSENLSIFEISKIIHQKMKINFKPIILPNIFWRYLKKTRKIIPYFEKILPYSLYNYLWRFGIIIDDVVLCNSDKIFTKYPDFKPKKFINKVNEVIT